jgi:sporulation protein YlmC with PRC-barrel domain
MNNRETVQAILNAIQSGDFDYAKTMLADEFRFSGPVPEPLNAKAWLRMSVSLKMAFPDLDYHFKVNGEEGEVVSFATQLSGTHTGKFDLTSMIDMGVIPATHKSFVSALQETKITIKEGKITAWVVEPTSGAGLMAILQQLDIYITDIIMGHTMWPVTIRS